MRVAIYPGSFDPITNGHLDIIERSRQLFDKTIVAIAHNSAKSGLFSLSERQRLIETTFQESKISAVAVEFFSGLLIDFARQKKACAIIRGLRAVSDFDYEYAMFQTNSAMCPEIETVFLLAASDYSFLSSSILKEFARYGRSVADYTPAIVNEALLAKFKS